MLIQVLWLLLSIAVLYLGAELTLESSEKLGRYLGLSPLVIGLLIIGFGTSLPEFFVSQLASFRGEPGIALGNIVGSNIANLFLILGVSGTLVKLNFSSLEIRNQFLFHIVLTGLLVLVLLTKALTWWNAALLGAFFAYYLRFTYQNMQICEGESEIPLENQENKNEEVKEEGKKLGEKIGVMILFKLLVGFVLLYGGGELLVSSGSHLAKLLGISSYIISVIFIAFGTSFPELVTSLLACYRKKDTDLITGNIIGSNIFNVAFVLASLVGYKIKITSNYQNEIIALSLAAIFLLVISLMKKNFSKPAGFLFLASYLAMVALWL